MTLADNLVKTSANNKFNYWSPLACLVEEQEELDDEEPPNTEHMCSVTTDNSKPKVKNKISEKWKQKLRTDTAFWTQGACREPELNKISPVSMKLVNRRARYSCYQTDQKFKQPKR